MKLVLKPVRIRRGDDGYWRIYTPMFREFTWVQGRFHTYRDAQAALREINKRKLVRIFESREFKQTD